MCSAKSRWRRRSTKRAISSRARNRRDGFTPWCRTAVMSPASAASRGRAQGRRDRRHHQRPRRLLPRPAFRRLSRGDGPCSAAGHGDPHLRRFALHDRAHGLGRLLPRMEPASFLVPRRDRRPRPSSTSRTARSSSIAAAGARKGCQRRGNPRGVLSAQKARCSGTAPTRSASKLSLPASARGCSTR